MTSLRSQFRPALKLMTLVWPWACIAITIFPVHAQSEPADELRAELIEKLRSASPLAGAVHVHFQHVMMPAQRRLIGFDYGSGAYYEISSSYVTGCDVRRQAFSGTPRTGGIARSDSDGTDSGRGGLDPFVPGLIAWEFIREPGLMTEVRRDGDAYLVERVSPHGARYPRPLPEGFSAPIARVIYRFSAEGLLRQLDRHFLPGPGFGEHRELIEFDLGQEMYAKYGVDPGGSNRQWHVLSFRFDQHARSDDFSLEGVETLALAAGFKDTSTTSAPQLSGGMHRRSTSTPPVVITPAEAGARVPAPPQTYVERTWTWWAAGTGVGVIVLALWLKRRAV